jgi:hypothetical protein
LGGGGRRVYSRSWGNQTGSYMEIKLHVSSFKTAAHAALLCLTTFSKVPCFMWLGSDLRKREIALIKSREGQLGCDRLKYARLWGENGVDFRSIIFVCNELEFGEIFYFLWLF